MSLTVETRIGKKYAIYLPKRIVQALGLTEGEKVLLRIAGNTVILECLKDPLQLALSSKKFASITPEEIEAISLEEQTNHVKNSP